MKFTEADKKILYNLHDHARAPVSWLSRKTGLTREIVDYSMKKLEKEGVIKGYIAKINQAYFCEGVATVLFKLTRYNDKRFKEIINYLRSHSSINWIAELIGTADIATTILYKNSEDLANTISQITEFMGSNLKEHHVSLYISEYKFTRRGLIYGKEEKPPAKIITFRGKQEGVKLDKKDFVILSELAKDCRIKNNELAKMIGLSEDMVRIRIKNLEKREVILGYTIILDVNAYGLEAYYMGLQVENMTKETVEKIKYYTHVSPYIVYTARTAGKYNFVFNICAKNRQHFREILFDIRNNLGSALVNDEFYLDIQEHKEIFVTDRFLEAKGI